VTDFDPMMVGEPLWTLENDRHCAEARVRAIAGIGQELRFSIDGELYYSHRDTAWGELDRAAQETRCELLACSLLQLYSSRHRQRLKQSR
jgi:hypothetical protein